MRLPLLFILCCIAFAKSRDSNGISIKDEELSTSNGTRMQKNLRSSKRHRLLSKFDQPQNKQRIVILAGPHKTASSSIQDNISRWTSVDPQVLPDWSWPVPDEVLEYCDGEIKCNAKGFYPLSEAFHTTFKSKKKREIFLKYGKSQVLDIYRDAIKNELKNGHNVVMGTEGLDFLVLREMTDFDNFLSVLPLKEDRDDNAGADVWGVEKEDVTIVVKFRAPRVEHLISVWHQCCAKEITFMELLNKLDDGKTENKLHILASFELSEVFLRHGFHVELLDMGGILHAGYDISNIVACDIMNANCTKEKEIVSDEENGNILPEVKNVKHNKGDMGGVTESQLGEIEKVLRRYDCNHQHVLKYENLTVLYNYDIDSIIGECSEMKERDQILSRHELAKKIKSIVNPTHNVDGTYYGNTDIGDE